MQYLISFLEGIITFISPCLLPMLPIYVSYFAGGGERTTKKTLSNALGFVLGFTLVFVALGALVGLLVSQPDNAANTADKENAVKITRTEALGDIVRILDRENCDDFVIFTDFGTGQYLEFKGYHPYIDGRAELFLKKNNKEFDYLNEYVRLCNAKLYYKDFLNKYNFNYIIVEKTNYYLYTSLSHTSFRIPRMRPGAMESSVKPILMKVSVSLGSAPNSPQMPAQIPASLAHLAMWDIRASTAGW